MNREIMAAYHENAFDIFCRRLIENEEKDVHKALVIKKEREVPLSTIRGEDLRECSYEDRYCIYKKTFYVRETAVDVHDPVLGEVLQYLPPSRRDVILLWCFLEYNDAQIGRILHITGTAVAYRRNSALKKLYELLEGREDETR